MLKSGHRPLDSGFPFFGFFPCRGRGRDAGYPVPPAPLPACGTPAPGSCLGGEHAGIQQGLPDAVAPLGQGAPGLASRPSPSRGVPDGLPCVRRASAPRRSPLAGRPTLPARSPVNASPTPLPVPAHDSGPAWLARPSLSGTCTRQHSAGFSRRTRTLGVRRARKPERTL